MIAFTHNNSTNCFFIGISWVHINLQTHSEWSRLRRFRIVLTSFRLVIAPENNLLINKNTSAIEGMNFYLQVFSYYGVYLRHLKTIVLFRFVVENRKD